MVLAVNMGNDVEVRENKNWQKQVGRLVATSGPPLLMGRGSSEQGVEGARE